MAKVIGIVGLKGVGKDFFATRMQQNYPQYKIIHFAKRLKDICAKVFDIPKEEFYSSVLKEKLYKDYKKFESINIDDYILKLNQEVGINLQLRGLKANNHRTLLQYVGSEYIRSIIPNYWVDYVKEYIAKKPGYYLIPDVRFPNEITRLQEFKPLVVMIHRPDINIKKDGHISENPDFLKPYVNLHVVSTTGDMEVLDIACQAAFEMDNKLKITIYSKGVDNYEI
jgi:hypothetical protein